MLYRGEFCSTRIHGGRLGSVNVQGLASPTAPQEAPYSTKQETMHETSVHRFRQDRSKISGGCLYPAARYGIEIVLRSRCTTTTTTRIHEHRTCTMAQRKKPTDAVACDTTPASTKTAVPSHARLKVGLPGGPKERASNAIACTRSRPHLAFPRPCSMGR